MIAFAASLVIGGTGMLAGATRWLAARSETTLLAARRAGAFLTEAGPTEAGTVAVEADWNSPAFRDRVEAALDRTAPIQAALLWLHEPQPILAWLAPRLVSARVVLVLGSLDGRPQVPEGAARIVTVRLGSLPTATGRRWLTDEEISAGAVAALRDGESRVVGELTPAE